MDGPYYYTIFGGYADNVVIGKIETVAVTKTLTNLNSSNTSTTTIKNAEYKTTLTGTTGYLIPESITVKIGETTLNAGTDYTYNNSTGVITIAGTKVTDTIVIQATGIAKIAALDVGDYITYNSATWIVMYNDNINGLQIAKQTPVDFTGTIAATKDGYNSSITILNNLCANYVNTSLGAISARCAGTNPVQPDDTTSYYTNTNNGFNISGYVEINENYIQDATVFDSIRTNMSFSKDFIIANRTRDEHTSIISFGITCMIINGDFSSIILTYESNDPTVSKNVTEINSSSNLAYFPIVRLSPNITISSGEGTSNSPYVYSYSE